MAHYLKQRRPRGAVFLNAAVMIFALACGGGGEGPTPPPPPPPDTARPATASLSGIISDESDGARVSGAVVTVGAASTTTLADGFFSFANLPQGTATILISAPGFDPLERGTQLGSGSNTRNVLLTRVNTVFETGAFTVYVPGGVGTVRGVFVFLYGGDVDARPMIRGDVDYYSGFPVAVGVVAEHRRRLMAFGRAHGFATIGTETPGSPSSLSADIRSALQNVGSRSGHVELAQAPLLVMGHSRGGCMAYQIAVQVPDQVIGVLPLAGGGVEGCHEGSPGPSVPVYIIFGQLEPTLFTSPSKMIFEEHRGRGGLWALAVESGVGHVWPNNDVVFNWAAAVTTRRLPETVTPGVPIQLRALSEASGWLVDVTSRVISPFACFPGDKRTASWVPSEQNARDLLMIAPPGSVPVVTPCNQ
jgi:dienelactone hydrolase